MFNQVVTRDMSRSLRAGIRAPGTCRGFYQSQSCAGVNQADLTLMSQQLMETTELSSYFHGFANIVLQLSYNSATHSEITYGYMKFQ